jgi:SAM-dependent methyltransferase
MTTTDFSERQRNEAVFHDQWAEQVDVATLLVDETFETIAAVENQYVLREFGSLSGKKILDYGCGAGEAGVYLAKKGAEVVCMDVSKGMLNAAHQLAAHHGVHVETRLIVDDRIPAKDLEFDLIYANGVLHHVDLDLAMPELSRILKADGTGCFIEPMVYNPVIEIYRRMATLVRTADERPISFRELKTIRRHFASVRHREFWLSTLAVFVKFFLVDRVHPNHERYWKKIYTDAERIAPLFRPLKRVDDWLLTRVPPLRWLCWNTVITVSHRGR